jgi:hypothetical protein
MLALAVVWLIAQASPDAGPGAAVALVQFLPLARS